MVEVIDWIKTNPIAIYAAILSTIAVGWNIYNNLQDRPKVKVTAKFGFTDSEKGISEHLLIITAINKGKRSIHLSSVGLRSNKEDLINMRTFDLPCELASGRSHSEWFEVDKLKNKQFDFAWYRDATGKIHKSKSIKDKLNNYFNSKKI